MLVALRINPEVEKALQTGKAVVALESAVITHGLPEPHNLELAIDLENTIRDAGAQPAIIGLLQGELVVGLNEQECSYLAEHTQKASLWNLAWLCARKKSAGTTVASSLHATAQAGIKVFATGGIGGVHDEDFDESADLHALSTYPVITVCAGPKSILNVKATLERLESLGIPVLAYQSDFLAGFHLPQTSYKLPIRCDSPQCIVDTFTMQRTLGLSSGLLVSKPVSEGIPEPVLSDYLRAAQKLAKENHISGKDLTPFLLRSLADLSQGKTVDVNLKLLKENAQLAAKIAIAISESTLVVGDS